MTNKLAEVVGRKKARPKTKKGDVLPRPLGVLVLVEEEEVNAISAGGVMLPQVSQDTQFLVTGKVLDVGEGMWNQVSCQYEPIPVKKGDRVLFIKVQSKLWKDPQTRKEYWFINMGNLLAVLPPLPESD